jgi:UDP-N-acetylglucosamine transferase subunit ALG13
MIFITVGSADPFDRLVSGAGSLTELDEVIVQRGRSEVEPPGTEVHDFLSYERVAELIKMSSAVICHAGVGSVLTSLLLGRKPIVMARRAELGEAVDDHQVSFARRLAVEGLVINVTDPKTLPEAVRGSDVIVRPITVGSSLAVDLRAYILELGVCPTPPL